MLKPFDTGQWPPRVRLGAVIAVTGFAFFLDAFSPVRAETALVYCLALLIVFGAARVRDVLVFGGFLILLTVVAYGVRYAADEPPTVFRLGVKVVSLALTILMLSMAASSRHALAAANQARGALEWRYRAIFRQNRFPIWALDFRQLLPELMQLKAEGITDIADYSAAHPDWLKSAKQRVLFTDMNPAMYAHFGLPTDSPLPRDLEVICADDAHTLTFIQMIIGGQDYYDDWGHSQTVTGDKREVVYGVTIAYEGDLAGYAIGSLIDVSERERALKALAQAQGELARAARVSTVGQMSASIAHELNQPLGAIVMNGETGLRYLRRTPPDVPSAMASIERAVNEANRATDIVRRTRELLAKRPAQPERLALQDLVTEAVELLGREVEAAGASLTIDLSERSAWMVGDRVALQQALVNFITNALQAVSDQPAARRRVTVRLAHDGDHALLSVHDTGSGLTDEVAEHVFDPFFTTKEAGMGVGLTISRSAVEAHGGVVSARNHPDGGAIFEAKLPLSPEA